jgi:hypothetical protein
MRILAEFHKQMMDIIILQEDSYTDFGLKEEATVTQMWEYTRVARPCSPEKQ